MDQSFPPLIQMAHPHAFRLGVPSYVYPADILPNVEALAPYVDDVELLLLESGKIDDRLPAVAPEAKAGRRPADSEPSHIPSADTIARLAELAQQHDLTYTVHFPIDRHLGSPDAGERRALQKQMLAIIDRTRLLKPSAYILHLEGIARDSTPARVLTWQKDIAALLPALVKQVGNPTLLCVENLNYPFAWCDPLLDTFGLSTCIDLGHLLVNNYNVAAHLQRHLSRTRVIHLHGVCDARDHLALTALPPARLRQLLNSIDNFTGVLTLEIFNYEGVRDSLVCLNSVL